jgi:Sigma-70, region 4
MASMERPIYRDCGARSDRDAKICSRRDAGVSFAEIGQEFGLTSERIRQIYRERDQRAARYENLAPLRAAFAKREARSR